VTTNWDEDDLPGLTAALRIGYAIGCWIAFAIHAVGVEIYVSIQLSYILCFLTLYRFEKRHLNTKSRLCKISPNIC
jgi:hypothetical protein